MSLFGLSKSDFTDISDLELDQHIENITEDFPYRGESLIKQFLIEKEVIVQRMRIRDSLHRVNGDGVNARKKGRLHRRVYDVQGPNHVWHIDTNHKLVRWYFVVFGSRCFEILRNQVPSNWTSSNYGIDVYLTVLDIIENLDANGR
ncbi:unnamed protein product [Porites evermanni]|uniref:Integrase core domain-containing protein n=1 Tax=Porites evermanni TaxID=104178 RepID=A0ABN8LRB1_9CNID|nr:unnamed protein product [Porites evermanni]